MDYLVNMVNTDKLQQVLSDFLSYLKSGTLSLESKVFFYSDVSVMVNFPI